MLEVVVIVVPVALGQECLESFHLFLIANSIENCICRLLFRMWFKLCTQKVIEYKAISTLSIDLCKMTKQEPNQPNF